MNSKFSSSRRRFLQTAALFSAGLASPLIHTPRAQSVTSAEDEFSDAIVIGSGFGGSVAALRLGQLGISTLILERGRSWPITPEQNTFATFRSPDRRAGWLRTTSPVFDAGFGQENVQFEKYTGVFERLDPNPSDLDKITSNGVVVLNGSGVGGGSLVYNAILYQPTRENFQRVFPSALSYTEMERVYYPRVRSILQPSVTPPDVLNTSFYRSTRVMLEQGRATGLPTRLLELGVDWNIVREEIRGTRVKSASIGETWYGINSGAKKSLDQNYLVQAQQTGKVQIRTLHRVSAIEERTSGGYRVTCQQINEVGEVVGTKIIGCRILFLGAGSMGTSALMVRAKAQGTLPRLNNAVGQGWGSNGDLLGLKFGLPITNIDDQGQGGPAGAVIEHFTNPITPVSLMTLAWWNAPFNSSLLGLGIAIPTKRGSFSYNSTTDVVNLNWPATANAEVVKSLQRTVAIVDRNNTSSTSNPITNIISPTSAHPLGGMVMGQACDLDGRVAGYRGLYVVDGALIPGSTACCNPALTIAAVAERCMDRLRPELTTVNT